MRRVLEIFVVQLLLLGCAVASEQQTNAKTLVIDVYSVKASDVVQQKAIALWAQNLREGKASLTEYPKILHADRPFTSKDRFVRVAAGKEFYKVTTNQCAR
jgi:hypothetical protein